MKEQQLECPLVSVIVPTFNAGKTIARCLESLVNQTYGNIEVMIFDNLSTDNTIEIVKSFRARFTFIELISQKDNGIYDAMNKGIQASRGDWLYFMGADDELHDRNVLSEIMKMRSTDACVVYGNALIVGDSIWARDGEIFDGPFHTKKILQKNICHQAILYKADFIKNEIGLFNTEYGIYGDWDFNLRCWARTNFQYVDLIFARFQSGGVSSRNIENPKFAKEYFSNILSYFGFNVFDPVLDDKDLPFYGQVLSIQRKENYFKYVKRWFRRKILNYK